MKYFLYGLLFLMAGPVAGTVEPVLEDFARGYQLETGNDAAIYRLPLPVDVYKTVVRSDLGDIRVFNNDKQPVPHAIRRPELKRARETIRIKLPFFPLHNETGKGTGDLDVTIDDDGTIIHIRNRGNELVAENAEINSYIIDLSAISQVIDELEFELTGNEGGYIKRASLQYSDDLNNWNTLVSGLTLAELDYGNHSLRKDRISLPVRKAKYLRFVWSENSNGIQISTIHASLGRVSTERERQWFEVNGKQSEKDKLVYEFDTGGMFAVYRVNIILPEDNTLIEAVLKSRRDGKAGWRNRYTGLFYNLTVKGNHLEGGPVDVGLTTNRYWLLEVKTRDGLGQQAPGLKFAWMPNDLYFLARGNTPFIFAYGNSRAGPPGRPVDALMKVLDKNQEEGLVARAVLGSELVLKGDEALKPDLEIPWQRLLLWAVLVIGVLVLGVMAMRLFKQINATGSDEG